MPALGRHPDARVHVLVDVELRRAEGACTSRLMTAGAELDPIFGQPRMGAIPVAISAYRG